MIRNDWVEVELGLLLAYLQPTTYIVESTDYDDRYKTPVLTPGKSFIKGYTNETEGIFSELPAIIFDDFTTVSRFVAFPFKVKSSAMKILVPASLLVNMKYTFYLMQVLQERSDTHKRYWISTYSKKNFPLAPLPEQRAIVARIEELFSELDNGINNLKSARAKLEIYRQAVLKKAFEGKLTKEWREKQEDLPTVEELLEQIKDERKQYCKDELQKWKKEIKDWEGGGKKGKKPLRPQKIKSLEERSVQKNSELHALPDKWMYIIPEEIASQDKYSIGIGPFGSNLKVSDYRSEGVPLVFVKNITRNDFSLDQKFISEKKLVELSAHSTKPLDILITKMGDPPGQCAIYPTNASVGVITSDCLKFRVFEKHANRRFFKYCIESNLVKKQLGMITQGVAQKKISVGRFKTLCLPFCSLKEQNMIVREIESRLSVCDKLSESIDQSLEKAEALRQSILKKAFSGKLLSEIELEACRQEPDWESAEKLLERIKKEKTKESKIKK